MTTENEQNIELPWFIDEGIPGVGQKPSWLPDKFKTIAELAKSHSELEKRLGAVPDKYDVSKSKFIDPDYVPFQDFLSVAKDKRVPQEVLDKMVDSLNKYVEEFSTDYKEEMKKLGDNAQERIITLDNWAKANLSKESYEGLTNSLSNAEAVKALEELRGKMMTNTPQIPSGNDNSNNHSISVEDMKIELASNLDKYKNDEGYRKDYARRLELTVKNNSSYIDKVGG